MDAQALAMLTAAIDRARELQVRVGVAVVDANGHLVAGLRMSGVIFPWVLDAAEGKALATVAWGGRPSGELEGTWDSQMRRWVSNSRGGRLLYLKGALPVRAGDDLIGAIGASGASAEQDEDIARAGVEAFLP
jgi:glc operon protein GlcG